MESSETLHVILEMEKQAPSTNRIASPSFQYLCSGTGTEHKQCSCPCTMSPNSFPAPKSLYLVNQPKAKNDDNFTSRFAQLYEKLTQKLKLPTRLKGTISLYQTME